MGLEQRGCYPGFLEKHSNNLASRNSPNWKKLESQKNWNSNGIPKKLEFPKNWNPQKIGIPKKLEFPGFSNSTEFRIPMNLHDSRVKFVKSLHMSTTPPAWSLLCAMNVFDALAGMSSHTGIDMDEKQAFQRGVGLRAQQGCTRPLLRLWPWCCCRRSEMACARKGERCGGQLLWERSFQKVP